MMMKRTRREVVFDHFDYTSHVKLGGGLTPGDVFLGILGWLLLPCLPVKYLPVKLVVSSDKLPVEKALPSRAYLC